MTILVSLYWVSLACIFYAYLGYPIALYLLVKIFPANKKTKPRSTPYEPSLSVILPAYNEGKILDKKITNTIQLDYPKEKIEIIIVSDGSTDNTREIAEKYRGQIQFYELPERSGKAAALNLGIQNAQNEIIVFSDASIMLAPDAIKNIAEKFNDPAIGCVSGEDHIEGRSSEGLYGRFELYLRNLESNLHSIVGASGSFYAQRKELCFNFMEGLAPDFLSVLNTVEKGYRAVTEPQAQGTMKSLKSVYDEKGRKVRTLIRGITTLEHKKHLMNPFRFGMFSFELISHKLMRWMGPFFLISLFLVNIFLLEHPFYLSTFFLQVLYYSLALATLKGLFNLQNNALGQISLFFVMVNYAILVAWYKYASGVRQEIWIPTKR